MWWTTRRAVLNCGCRRSPSNPGRLPKPHRGHTRPKQGVSQPSVHPSEPKHRRQCRQLRWANARGGVGAAQPPWSPHTQGVPHPSQLRARGGCSRRRGGAACLCTAHPSQGQQELFPWFVLAVLTYAFLSCGVEARVWSGLQLSGPQLLFLFPCLSSPRFALLSYDGGCLWEGGMGRAHCCSGPTAAHNALIGVGKRVKF